MALNSISLGVPTKLFDADAAAAPVNTPSYALPSADKAKVITWSTYFASAPTSPSIKLQISMDETVWSDLDTSTVTTGEVKTATVMNARFIRARKEAQTGGGALTVIINVGT